MNKKMNSRRDFLKLLSLFSFAGSAPLLQAQKLKRTNQPEQPVRIGYLPITDAHSSACRSRSKIV